MDSQLNYIFLVLLAWKIECAVERCPKECSYQSGVFQCIDETNILTAVPSCLNGHKNVESLQMAHHKIPALRKWIFESNPHIKHVSLADNGITNLERGLFTKAVYIQTLDLSHNSIADIPHGVFKTPHGLTHLKELDLGYNEVSSLETGMFGGLTSLRKLVLDGNRIQHVDDDAFSHLWQLEDISLRHCDVIPSRFFAALETLSQFHLERIFIGENNFGCTCDWLELVRMFNKYKVAIGDVEDTPSCDDSDIKCDFSVHQTLQDLEVVRQIHLTKEVLHVNLERHVSSLILITIMNVAFIFLVFIIQCWCGKKKCCAYDYVNVEDEAYSRCPCIISPDAYSNCGQDGCWYGCDKCCQLAWRDGSEYHGLKEFAPWGPPWHKEKVLAGYRTAYDQNAEGRLLSKFTQEAMNHIGTIRNTLQQPNYPAGCFDCQGATHHGGTKTDNDKPGNDDQLPSGQHKTCAECQDTARNMNILFNDNLNLEYVNQGLL